MLAHRSAHRKKKHPQTRKLHPLRPQVHQQQHQHQRLSPHRNQQRSLRLNRLKKHRSITSRSSVPALPHYAIKAGNNQERTDTLTEQVAILEGYLPEQIEGEALMALIDEAVAETGATTKKDMGRVMGTLTQRTGGNFDKAAAAATLNQRLS